MGEKKSYFDEQDEGSVDDAVIATEARFDETTTSRTGATALRWVLTLIVFFLFAGMAWLTWSLAPVVVGALASAVLFSCMHVVLEWERSVVLRFGKFNRVAGPGLIFMIPLVEYSAATVDMRMRSTAFKAEHVLTADLVPVNVDAVLDGVGCREGVLGGEELRPSGVLGGANHPARRDGRGEHRPAEHASRADRP